MQQRRRLRVFLGADPADPHSFHQVYIHQSPAMAHRVDTRGFKGEITVDVGAAGKLKIQVAGQFKPVPLAYRQGTSSGANWDPRTSSNEWTMDDVLFGVELDRPVTRQALGVPAWVENVCRKWMDHMDATLLVESLVDDTPRNSRYPRPTILTPLVCGATHLNAWKEEAQAQPQAAGVMSLGNAQKQWEHAMVDQAHPVWISDPRDGSRSLAEYNAWMWYGFSQALGNVDPFTRCALYRPSTSQPSDGRHRRHHGGPRDLPTSERRQDHSFDTTASSHHYAFEFVSTFFDVHSFVLRTQLESPEQAAAMHARYGPGYDKSMERMLQKNPVLCQVLQNWSMDLYEAVRDARGVARVYIVCRSRPFGPENSVVYFWTICLEMSQAWLP